MKKKLILMNLYTVAVLNLWIGVMEDIIWSKIVQGR